MSADKKTAVVTGAASGIGAALALLCASRGMNVVAADLDEASLAATADGARAQGADVLTVAVDVSDEAAVNALRDATFARFGTAHLLCNNAGVIAGLARPWEIPASEWKWAIGVNLMGIVHGVNAFVPRMVDQSDGYVVNTSSSAGLAAGYGAAAYSATKHAVVAFSEALANDLAAIGSPVGVSVLCPEAVKTRIHESGRLRPDGVTAPDGAYSEAMTAAVSTLTVHGIDPAVVAQQVLDAVGERRFYVMTDSERTRAAVKVRFEAILAGGAAAGRPAGARPAVSTGAAD